MRDFLVYLAGPISGLNYGDGQGWRDYAVANLPEEIHGISPLRCKEAELSRVGIIEDAYEGNVLTSQRGLTQRDKFDCLRSDIVLFNFLNAPKVSIGTCIEVGWADAAGIPSVVIMDPKSLHDHPMIRDIASFRVPTLEEALKLIEIILLPTGKGTRRPASVRY